MENVNQHQGKKAWVRPEVTVIEIVNSGGDGMDGAGEEFS